MNSNERKGNARRLRNSGIATLTFAGIGISALSQAVIFVNQTPAQNGGVSRWSKLWVDPTGNNDLDGDSICYEDFTLANPSQINHIEWWGDVIPSQGFQIEFWKQDPGTIAYQPLGVFRGSGAQPETSFKTTSFTTSSDPSNTVHFSLNLAAPVSLAANNAANPRWFIAIIGLTDVPYLQWNWSQGLGGSTRTFQFVRGGHEGGGDLYRVLPEGRAMLLSGTPVPEPAALAILGLGFASIVWRRRRNR